MWVVDTFQFTLPSIAPLFPTKTTAGFISRSQQSLLLLSLADEVSKLRSSYIRPLKSSQFLTDSLGKKITY